MSRRTISKLTPVVLIVEDREDSLKIRRATLESEGFVAIGVRSEKEALRELIASPSVDLVLADINLDTSVPTDTSGLSLAKKLRKSMKRLPIIGYSGVFSEGDISQEDLKVFNDYFATGSSTAEQLGRHISDWRRLALRYRRWRAKEASKLVESFSQQQELGKIEGKDFVLLRKLIPFGFPYGPNVEIKPSTKRDLPEEALTTPDSIDEVLQTAGYRLFLIEPGNLRPRVADRTCPIVAPVILWISRQESVSIAEVFGHSYLYSHGNTDEKAIEAVLLLMDTYYSLLVEENPLVKSLGPEAKRLQNFLKHVFGG